VAVVISVEEIVSYFKEIGWPVEEVDKETGYIFTSVRGKNIILDLEICLNLEWHLLQLTLLLPVLVPFNRMAEAMALVNRINYDLPLGHFEIGLESRQLAYYAAVPVNDTPFIKSQFEALLTWAIDIVDEEHPRLMQVLYSGPAADEVSPNLTSRNQRRFDA
jgi:hypothetical protein